ncbi:MAG: hypothetical protein ABS99_03655 [Acetobacteraceae bacterium SCN 69-10]|nr:hypothetical protein [Rhodospirillales bacterium]ODU59468.1 MAG: hypothetical protein ABS99_03655 [Acetobacteraceae bacterium SCN 69-10]OJY74593.1 MAG: hypothetical protein BGP12_06435 [Rhodospirillales bacterium 70-18]
MTDKVFYMPFDVNGPQALFAQMEYGNMQGSMKKNQIEIDREIEKGNMAVEVWYDGKKAPFLAGLSEGQVYIRGHGMPGFRSIEGGRGGERVDYHTVVDRIIASGLRKTFAGKIKCFNCHSAETGVVGSDPEVEGPPFARLIADEMYTRGYKFCTFYGYLGAVDSFAKDGSAGKHKYARGLGGVELGRASEGRIQFRPTIKFSKPNIFKRIFA